MILATHGAFDDESAGILRCAVHKWSVLNLGAGTLFANLRIGAELDPG